MPDPHAASPSPPSESPAIPPAVPPRRRHRLLAFLCWLYLILMIALCVFIRTRADRWWPATLLAFGPRWTYALPLAPLALAALLLRRRSLWVLAAAAIIALFPIMDLRVPWKQYITSTPAPAAPTLRLLTCNTHNNALDGPALAALLARTNPDLITFQEWNGRFTPIFNNGPWHFRWDGEFFLASRYPFRKMADITLPGHYWPAICYEIQLPSGPAMLVNVHLASPHAAFRAALHNQPHGIESVELNTSLRLQGATALETKVRGFSGPVLLSGDFNLPPDSTIFQDHLAWLTDAFAIAGAGFGPTYHAPFTLTRIDHILANASWEFQSCWVGPDVGSPHRPLLADLTLKPDSK